MQCKGCNEQIDYWPLARVKTERANEYYHAGPAITHTGVWCGWFQSTRAAEIVAYIEYERERFKVLTETPFNPKNVRVKPLPELATK